MGMIMEQDEQRETSAPALHGYSLSDLFGHLYHPGSYLKWASVLSYILPGRQKEGTRF